MKSAGFRGAVLLAAALLLSACEARHDIVRVAAAQIEYDAPGDWEVSGDKPMNAQHICFPELQRKGRNAVIFVLLPPMLPGVDLETLAGVMTTERKDQPGVTHCELDRFSSNHQVSGFNLRFGGTGKAVVGVHEATESSFYLLLNRKGDIVSLQYTADKALFDPAVDASIRQTLALSAP